MSPRLLGVSKDTHCIQVQRPALPIARAAERRVAQWSMKYMYLPWPRPWMRESYSVSSYVLLRREALEVAQVL